MQTVNDLTDKQIIDYNWLDEVTRNLDLANQGGFDIVAPLIDISLSEDETTEDFKSSLIQIQRALNSYREAISKGIYQVDGFKSNIINRANTPDQKIMDNDLELLERIENYK